MRSSDLRPAALLFVFFFTVVAAYWIQKPLRTAQFLTAFGPEYLPHVKLASALLILPVVLGYSILIRRFRPKWVIAGCSGAFAIGSVVFWHLFTVEAPDWIHSAYFLYVDVYVTVMVALAWSLANALTTPEQARRIFGFVGAGGILGGTAGSATTGWMVGSIGAANLLLICAALLVMIAGLALFVVRARRPVWAPSATNEGGSLRASIAGARSTLRSPYLRYIVVMIACYEVVSNIVDYQFSAAATVAFSEEQALAAYMGKLGSLSTGAALMVQIVFTTWILRSWGPGVGLLILPAVLGLGSLVYLATPLFPVVAVLFSSDGSLHYSVNQTSKEVLYSPVEEATLYQAKAFIDMFLYRFAKGIGALLIVGSNRWLVPSGWEVHHFGMLSLPFILAWVAVAYLAGRRFDLLTAVRPARKPTDAATA